jgi:hypothetical protein
MVATILPSHTDAQVEDVLLAQETVKVTSNLPVLLEPNAAKTVFADLSASNSMDVLLISHFNALTVTALSTSVSALVRLPAITISLSDVTTVSALPVSPTVNALSALSSPPTSRFPSHHSAASRLTSSTPTSPISSTVPSVFLPVLSSLTTPH